MRSMQHFAAAALAPWLFAAGAAFAAAAAQPPPAGDRAGELRDRYAALRPQLERNDFGRSLHLESHDEHNLLEGDVFAVLDQPYARVASSLREARQWCEVLILPYNTKHCSAGDDGHTLSLFVGRKSDTPLPDAYRIDFRYSAEESQDRYLQVSLGADAGPLGTRDYRIRLEATPVGPTRTFIHLSYAYRYGAVSNLAMQAYLATTGASKVGFTVEGRDENGKPRFVRGMRGVMERNTMRYYLAIEAYVASIGVPDVTRVHRRVEEWFDASERFARQLHEMERGEYVAMKEREMARLVEARP